ncbi:MAG: dephospho-CoA kinase [Runella slithyformis]|nr:MAG: dephospho-CoA kinase [Runella slithyformis]
MPLQIGITGGIGSGKSIVCRIFSTLGVPIYDADSRAKWLINHQVALQSDIIDLLGTNAFVNGQYNRPWVAAQVFDNPTLLQQLNAVVHPRVFADSAIWLQQHQNAPYVLRESALATKGANIDKVLVVSAPLDLRVARIKQRDPHRTEIEIRNIIARQPTDAEQLQMADYVITNDDTQLLILRVQELHAVFCSL